MKGLLIKSPWIDLILSGKKTWEIRGKNTQNRDTIALIKSGTKTIVGIARITDVKGPFTSIKDFSLHSDKHLTPNEEIEDGLPYEETYAWVLSDVTPLYEPVPYEHPMGSIIWVNLEDINEEDLLNINKTYKIPKAENREKFLKSVQKDLEILNGETVYENKKTGDYDEFSLKTRYFKYQDKSQIEAIYKKIRERLILSDKDFIQKMESSKNILEYFANGSQIDINKIKPEIRICKSNLEKDIFKYCRYLQEVPNSGGIGRRIAAIVYDVGQEKEYIMGIIGLASGGYTLKCRDDYFGWNIKNIDSHKELKELKDSGLRSIMQLAVSLAVPPYNYLYLGKLMALLALSNPIQEQFNEKYGQNLLALITTSATGIHSSVYNRIQIRKIFNDNREKSEFLERIGKSSEYSSLVLSDETKKIARELLSNTQTHSKVKRKSRNTFSSDGLITRAMQICGLNREILELNEKAVYLGALHSNNIELLRGKNYKPELDLSVQTAFDYWKNHLLDKKIISEANEGKINVFSSFNKNNLSISEQLKLF